MGNTGGSNAAQNFLLFFMVFFSELLIHLFCRENHPGGTSLCRRCILSHYCFTPWAGAAPGWANAYLFKRIAKQMKIRVTSRTLT